MKLFTKAIEQKMRKAGPKGQTSICKIFVGNYTLIVFGSEVVGDDEILYGLACIDGSTQTAYDMYGTVMRSEVEAMRVTAFRLPAERDLYFKGGKKMDFYFEYFRAHKTLAGAP